VSKFTPLDERLHSYLVAHGARQDEVLRRVQAETAAMGELANMQIAPDQGAFMELLARVAGASEALEIGTFTGYSAICIARGLRPGGRLLCLELDEGYAETAARNLEAAGVAGRVEIRVGPAADSLRALPERELFDFVFIDADKAGYPLYYEESLARTRPGGLILLDNVLAGGRITRNAAEVEEEDRRAHLAGLQEVNALVRDDGRVDLAMVGIADGLTIARKR
jgi:caffeoyl-CoA O-methyltransferase